MIFSRSSQYAIQALVLLATKPAGSYVLSREIARELDLPLPYLSKLMLLFVHAQLVESRRGRHGGFRLIRNAEALSMKDIMLVVGGASCLKECFLGFKECSDETACALHSRWRPVKLTLLNLLEQQNVAKLAKTVSQGKCRLRDLNFDQPERLLQQPD